MMGWSPECYIHVSSFMKIGPPVLEKISEGFYHIRGMIKNNVDFCYKKLYSQHRLIKTITFRFGNCMGSENKIFVLILFIPLVHGLFLLPWLRTTGAVQ